MSAALLTRTGTKNPDNDFILYGDTPHYTERTSFYPTNSDITTTTKNLSQHEYRADLYKDILEDDQNLRGSLRTMSRSLRLVSNNIRKNLVEESTAKRFFDAQDGRNYGTVQNGVVDEEDDLEPRRREDREWLANSEWTTASGHQLSYTDNVPSATVLRPTPSLLSSDLFSKTARGPWEADKLHRSVNLGMDLAEVPLTRFTNKHLMASEYFPVTMSRTPTDGPRSAGRRSRSRTRSPQRLTRSARMRPHSPMRSQVTDNFRDWMRLEKLYCVTSEAPSIASAPAAILSPYQEEMARLRLERLRLEEEHLKELNRLATLERIRGPKPKWYELKDTQFHFEAMKNNDLIRTQDRWREELKKHELDRSEEFQQRRTRTVSF